jgi:hypothetical protein
VIEKIISGGQTGVDRGALDAALASGFPCGGWCPAERVAEDGRIPACYPVQELPGAGYRRRTVQNVRDSDATAILCRGQPSGGTRLTALLCVRERKPVLLIDAVWATPARAAQLLLVFVEREGVRILNVAGPRESGWPQARAFSRQTIARFLSGPNGDGGRSRRDGCSSCSELL